MVATGKPQQQFNEMKTLTHTHMHAHQWDKTDICHDKQLHAFSRQCAERQMVANWELTSTQRSVSAATHHEELGARVHYCMC